MAEICEKCGRFLSDRYQHECGKPAPPKEVFWTPERVARLLEMHRAESANGDIAAELDCTTQAVAGKLFRELGLRPKVPKPPRPPKPPAPPPVPAIDPVVEFTDPTPDQLVETPKRPAPMARGSAAARQRYAAHGMSFRKHASVELPAPVAIEVPAPSAKPITICDLTAQTCRWPLWDMKLVPSSEHLYCGAETIVPGHYCSAHTAMAYSKR